MHKIHYSGSKAVIVLIIAQYLRIRKTGRIVQQLYMIITILKIIIIQTRNIHQFTP